MDRKYLPFIIMLLAGVIVSIITFIKGFKITDKIIALLLVMLIFYLIGWFVKSTLDNFEKKNREEALKEGEVTVIEKEQGIKEENENENEA